MGLPMVGIHSGSELSKTSNFASYSSGGYDANMGIDSSGNIYVAYLTGTLVKFNTKSQIVWQKTLSGMSIQAMDVDSSGNIYLAGTAGSYPTPTGIVVKIDTNGSITWQRGYQLTQWSNSGGNVSVDSSGNVYCGFWYGPSNNDYADFAKYNSSGTIQWRLQITHPTLYYNCRPGAIATDSSGNSYMGAHTYNSSFGWESYAIKVNSSGTVQWQRKIAHASNSVFISYETFIDSSGNVYFYGFQSASRRSPYLIKLNSSGSILWQKNIAVTDNDLYPGHARFDGTYFYIQAWGTKVGDSYNKAWTLTIDTSGTIVSQKSLSMDSLSVYTYGIAVSSTHIHTAGYGPYKWLTKTPVSGSKKIGTYPGIGHTFTYDVSTYSLENSTASGSSGSLSISSVSATSASTNVALTDAAGTYAVRSF